MDGLDMCLSKVSIMKDYSFNYEIINSNYEKFDDNTIELIKKTINDNAYLSDLSNHLGKKFTDMVKKYYSKDDMDIISMHGQTIKHIEKVESIQSGNPEFLYNEFKVPVVYNFRYADIMRGGNGAPLMPFLDWLLFREYGSDVITLNIGGISNISYIKNRSQLDDVVGFDTGPGMSLIDEFVLLKWNCRYDNKGLLATKGEINNNLLAHLMNNDYIRKSPPKSTGRDEFGIDMINSIVEKFHNINKFDLLRTLVRFTAESIILNLKFLDNLIIQNSTLIISGGGINNKLLIDDIKAISNFHNIIASNIIGIDSNYKEAFLMSVLGLGRVNEMNTNVPSVTGASEFVSCGDIYG